MKKVIDIRVVVGLVVILCFMFGSVGLVHAASPSDIDNSWAKGTITSWIDRGLIEGYADGSFKPNQTITRAEVASLINRSFAYSGEKTISFTDVKSSDWFYKDVITASAEGYMSGYPDGTFKPKAQVSRQELAVITAKLLALSGTESYVNYEDTKSSPEWSKGGIGAVIDAKLMGGYPDQTFQPSKSATRAEVVVILDKAAKLNNNRITHYYNKSGTYGPNEGSKVINGNVVVNAPGVTLQNLTIKGDLLLGIGIGNGDAIIKGVTVKGSTTVEGGGANSIHFEDSMMLTVIVNKKDGSIRIVIEGSTTIQEIILESGAKLEEASGATGGGFNTVTLSELLPEGTDVELVGSFETVDIKSKSINISIPSGSIGHLNVGESAANTNIDVSKDAKIVAVVLDAIAKIVGQGQIEKATINTNGSSLEKKPTSVIVKEGVEANVGGEKVSSTPVTPLVTSPVESDSPPSSPPLTAAELLATAAVVTTETLTAGLAADGTDTQAAIDAAQVDLDSASTLVTALSSSTVKAALATRLTAVQTTITSAQNVLNAVNAATTSVDSPEAAANSLAGDGTDTQLAINGAQAAYGTASGLVADLPSSTAKAALVTRLTAVQTTITSAQNVLNAVNEAMALVVAAETTADGLAVDGSDTQGAINTAQTDHNTASGLVTALPNSTAKTALVTRLTDVQATIDDAQDVVDTVVTATASVVTAETTVDGLAGDGTDIQSAINTAQMDHDAASTLVTALPSSTAKTALVTRLTDVQAAIDDAQSDLDAVIAATASVGTAETTAGGLAGDGTDIQSGINTAQTDHDAATTLVTALPSSTAKTALVTRLTDVQATIDDAQSDLDAVIAATASVAAAETTAGGLAGDGSDTQGAINTAQTDYDTASGLVTALPNSTVKTVLEARLVAVQTTIDDAQDIVDAVIVATGSVVAAETTAGGLAGDGSDTQGAINTAQTDHDTASGLVTALPNSTVKTALEARLVDVQTTIDDAQDIVDTVVTATASVGTAETTAGGLAGDGTDIQSGINTAQTDHDAASTLVTALPSSTSKSALVTRLTDVQVTIDDAQSDLDAVIAATASVGTTETTAGGLVGDGTDIQSAINTAQTDHDVASTLVTALPSSTAKTALVTRLTAVQATIDDAQFDLDAVIAATGSVVAAETTAGGLAGDGSDTQGAINTAQTDHDTASGLVTALPNSTVKTALEARLVAVQPTIDDAQDIVDTVVTATASVVAAETTAGGLAGDGTDLQSGINTAQTDHDAASTLVTALPSSTSKSALVTRLTDVQATIDDAQSDLDDVIAATASVATAEATADGLADDGTDTQGAIDAAQADHDTASGLVADLPSSTAKTGLTTSLSTVQTTINYAQHALEIIIALQEASDEANTLISTTYTATSWSALQAALALPQTTLLEKETKAEAINSAIDSLIVRVVTSIFINILSGSNPYNLNPLYHGSTSHITLMAEVRDQFGVAMTLETFTWSHTSNAASVDTISGIRQTFADINIISDNTSRSIIVTVTSTTNASVQGTYLVNVVDL